MTAKRGLYYNINQRKKQGNRREKLPVKRDQLDS